MSSKKRSGSFLARLTTSLLMLVGSGMVVYPFASQWQDHLETYNSIQKELSKPIEPTERDEKYRELDEYNKALPGIASSDPFDGRVARTSSEKYQEYLKVGSLSRSAPNDPFGFIEIPKIKEKLPIFHGTSDDVLNRGVGHLFGSAFPIGGTGSHAVLTGHSGMVTKTIFTNLNNLERGDTIDVTVLNDTARYRVISKKTIEPSNIDDLYAVPDKDLLTLITCTPIGVNTHRLLVTAERVDIKTPPKPVVESIHPGFPWFLPVAATLWLCVLAYLFVPLFRNKK